MTDIKINQKYQAIVLYEQKLINDKQAADSLGVKSRQFFRISKRFRESSRNVKSLEYLAHPAWNKSGVSVEKKILKLNIDYPNALNFHLSWLARDLHKLVIKPPTIRNILIRNKAYVPFSKKKDRAYKKFQATHFGALTQLDTSEGYWLRSYPKIYLILALDDATRTILKGQFFEHDSTLNNMAIIRESIRNYGIPALFYTDNDSKFKVIRHGKSNYQNYQKHILEGQAETEIKRVLTEVGSGLITHLPYQPQGKDKIEKLFRFVQNCFIKNQRSKNLKDINLNFNRWARWYDERNHRSLGIAPKIIRERLIKEKKVAFSPLKEDLNLDNIFSIKDERKPDKRNIFSYGGKEYQLPLEKVSYPGKVELRILPDNRMRVFREKEMIAELKA